jgi:hypothetical protein
LVVSLIGTKKGRGRQLKERRGLLDVGPAPLLALLILVLAGLLVVGRMVVVAVPPSSRGRCVGRVRGCILTGPVEAVGRSMLVPSIDGDDMASETWSEDWNIEVCAEEERYDALSGIFSW